MRSSWLAEMLLLFPKQTGKKEQHSSFFLCDHRLLQEQSSIVLSIVCPSKTSMITIPTEDDYRIKQIALVLSSI